MTVPNESGADVDDGTQECSTCVAGLPEGECSNSRRVCGHHSNESWEQDQCSWCGEEFGEAS